MTEEIIFETVPTQDESPIQQLPVVNENLDAGKAKLDGESTAVDTVNQQPESTTPLEFRHQSLTHISHQIHSPQSWNFFSGEDIKTALSADNSKPPSGPSLQKSFSQSTIFGEATEVPFTPSKDTYRRSKEVPRDSIAKRNEKNPYDQRPTTTTTTTTNVIAEERERVLPLPSGDDLASRSTTADVLNLRESLIERREREFDRREREIDRRERDLERRERELERRQREFDFDRGRINAEPRQQAIPQQHLQEMMEVFKKQIQVELTAERRKTAERETLFEEKVMKRVNDVLENERQLYGVMKMSDHEVNEMMERSVGYLLQNDEDIADRVRFQSLIYLTQERLASEAGLQPPQGSDSFSLSWRLALGPSVVTEERYNKALELLKGKDLQETTKNVVGCKRAMEYAVEYTSHLRKEGTETGDHSFSLGRIPRKDYMESVERHSKGNAVEYEALKILVGFICPEN